MKTLLMAFVALAIFSGAARADGLFLSPAQLPQDTRDALSREIRTARSTDPKPFAALAAVRQDLPVLESKKRGGIVPISRMLKAMGEDAFLPVVEELAFNSTGVGDLPPTAALAWKVGMLETLGNLRDPRAEPVLNAVLSGSDGQYDVVRAAAEALGKLESDSAAQTLVTLASTAGPKQLPVLAGMGTCRRVVIANALATGLESIEDDVTAKRVIKALGDVGNAWAWQTPGVAHRDEEAQVRRIAAEALVKAFVRFEGEGRGAASNALMVVDAPITAKLIAEARRGADVELASALDELAARFARNPTR